jgi:AraC-like DNA-binding protein
MDAIAGLLDGPRARAAFVLRCTMGPPWSLRIEDRAPLAVLAIARGHAWIVADDESEPPIRIGRGDVALVRGPDPYTVADDPATTPSAIVHPGQRCETLDGEPLADRWRIGVRTWGNDADGSTIMLTGVYERQSEVSRRMLRALPRVVVVRGEEWDSPLVGLLAEEAVRDEPGQEAVLDRLLDLLAIAALRVWLARAEADAPGWYRAHADPVVGRALRLMEGHPAHPWTLAELAHEVSSSRAALARRFHELVGEPPMAFLTGWRIALAADLLRDPDATLGSVAERVGYGSPFALSSAFKRVRGVSPREFRAEALAPVA